MIIGLFHPGSGVGNQLFRYIAVKTLALDKGYEFGMVGVPKCDFLQLEPVKDIEAKVIYPDGRVIVPSMPLWEEKKIIENGLDIRSYDPEINFVVDNTVVDGEFQDIKYWGHRLNEIDEWLKVEPMEMPNNKCIINFRGGEYALFNDLFLPWTYWEEAIRIMRNEDPSMDFEVHTDDTVLARKFFPMFDVIENPVLGHSRNSNMGYNWRALRHAKYMILSNSSFAILPALLNENAKKIIAPRYWARHNTKQWVLPANYYKKFTYI